ncbi:MAG: 4-aminobutyrate--2-oxoglutarate transaminase [Chloroflexi bacterium]|nr:4-aminobutyrate--2-oxoglutarate transaminase [Chloroflexota bacterium]
MSAIRIVSEIPGPKSRALVARRAAATARGAAYLTPLAIRSAQGARVTDADGNQLLDFAGGIGTLAVGHNEASVVAAIHAQTDALIHMCAIVASYEPFVALAEKLNEITPGDFPKKTVLLNSGAEAVEAAVKIARAATGRAGIIVFEGAYHGRTNLTMAMTSKYALFKRGFGPFAPEIYRLPFPNPFRRPDALSEEEYIQFAITQLEQALIAQVDPSAVAAVVLEPVQGEGGFLPTPPRFLQRLRELCDEHGMLLVLDEVQCGFGRTGALFACEHYGVVPDLLVTAKSLAGGMPLAAVTGRAELVDAPHPGGLGGTYSGNPLACAAALAAVEQIRSPAFLARAHEVGRRLRAGLQGLAERYAKVGEVRGLGTMLALELVQDRESKTPAPELTNELCAAALRRGLIVIRAGLFSNCLRFLPPLNISDVELDEGLAVLETAFGEVVGKGIYCTG